MVGNCGEGWRHKEGSLLSSSTKGVPFLTAGNIFVDLLLHHIKLGSRDAGSIFRVYFPFKKIV